MTGSFEATADDTLRLARRVHVNQLTPGFSTDDNPALPPLLGVVIHRPTAVNPRRLVVTDLHIPRAAWDQATPTEILNGLQVGRADEHVKGVVFSFEMWSVRNLDTATKNKLAPQRMLRTHPAREPGRMTNVVMTNDTWALLYQHASDLEPTVMTSATAETNPDHHMSFHMSGIPLALRALCGRLAGAV